MSEIHVVALSGGKDSTAMSLRLMEVEPRDYLFVCTPTGDELPEMWAHWRYVGRLLGKPIQPIIVKGGLNGLVKEQRMIPNARARWCTRMLKIEPWKAFLLRLSAKHERIVSYVGLRADEPERQGGDYGVVPGVESRFPMREWGWTLSDVQQYLGKLNVTVPDRTDCARCFFQRLDEWWQLWKDHPDTYQDACDQEDWIELERGTKHTWRSDSRDTWPAALDELRSEFVRGRRPRGAGVQDLFGGGKCRVCSM